jgi:TonB family protein
MQDSHTKNPHHATIPLIARHGTSLHVFYALLIISLIFLGSLSWVSQAFPEEFSESEIETLDIIEITGAVIKQEPRVLNFPIPDIHTTAHLSIFEHLARPELKLIKQIPTHSRIILDQTAKTGNLHIPVRPLKTERPVYPRRAREQGWHGRVILRLLISAHGTVEASAIHQSSGYQLLDDNAMNAATQWTFQPAKNGGFPVASTVNIPIQFDLQQ